jgi:hypothetical protein
MFPFLTLSSRDWMIQFRPWGDFEIASDSAGVRSSSVAGRRSQAGTSAGGGSGRCAVACH